MKKENVLILAQLITAMKDSVSRLESAYNRGDIEGIRAVKKEILNLQKEIDGLL